HGITRITRLTSDNGPNYRSNAFARSIRGKVSRHQRTRPYTPRHNGKVERFQRITVDEFLYAEVFESEQERRNRHGVWLHHYNYHRPHTACGDQPPASRLHASVDNVMTNYNYASPRCRPGTSTPRSTPAKRSSIPTRSWSPSGTRTPSAAAPWPSGSASSSQATSSPCWPGRTWTASPSPPPPLRTVR